MPTHEKHPEDRKPGLTWSAVSGVQPVVFVGRLDDRPLAIVEKGAGASFRETLCTGEVLGEFASLEDSQRALSDWVAEHAGA